MKLKKENKSINENKLILKRHAQRMSPKWVKRGVQDIKGGDGWALNRLVPIGPNPPTIKHKNPNGANQQGERKREWVVASIPM